MNAPSLRFRSDDGSQYPEWKRTTLGEVFEQTSIFTAVSKDIPLFSLTVEDGLTAKSERYDRSFITKKTDKYKKVLPCEFAYNPMNMTLGAVGYNDKEKPVAISGYYVSMRAKPNYSHNFLKTLLRTEKSIQLYKLNATGTLLEKQRVQFPTFSSIKMAFPSLPEQTKIANFLSAVDEKITLTDRKLTLMKDYKKGVLQQIFSQQIRFRADDGSEYPEWLEKRLGDIVSIRSPKYDPKNNEHLKCVELDCIKPEVGVIESHYNSDDQQSIKNRFKAGAVLFGKLRPYLRKYALAPFDGVCSTEIWVMTSTVLLNPFLFYLVQTDGFIQLSNKSSGSKMPRADWSLMAMDSVMYPSLPEQKKIADFLSSIDDKITLIDRQLTQLRQYKKALLQQMFI